MTTGSGDKPGGGSFPGPEVNSGPSILGEAVGSAGGGVAAGREPISPETIESSRPSAWARSAAHARLCES